MTARFILFLMIFSLFFGITSAKAIPVDEYFTIQLPSDVTQFTELSNTGRYIAAGFDDGSVNVWGKNNPKPYLTHKFNKLDTENFETLAAAFSLDDKYLAICYNNIIEIDDSWKKFKNRGIGKQQIVVYKLEDKSIFKSFSSKTIDISYGLSASLAFSPENRFLSVGISTNSGGTGLFSDGYVSIYDINNPSNVKTIKPHNEISQGIQELQYAPNGEYLAFLCNARGFSVVEFYETKTLRYYGTLSKENYVVYTFAMSEDNSSCVTIGEFNDGYGEVKPNRQKTNLVIKWSLPSKRICL